MPQSLKQSLFDPLGNQKKIDPLVGAFNAVYRHQMTLDKKSKKDIRDLVSQNLESCVSETQKHLPELPGDTRARDLVDRIFNVYDAQLIAVATVLGGVMSEWEFGRSASKLFLLPFSFALDIAAQEIQKICTSKEALLGNWVVLDADRSLVAFANL
eukprot:Selendium_serpulae@DN5676_c0_g1_i2.p1